MKPHQENRRRHQKTQKKKSNIKVMWNKGVHFTALDLVAMFPVKKMAVGPLVFVLFPRRKRSREPPLYTF